MHIRNTLVALAALLVLPAVAAKELVNIGWDGVALKGHDPVAYFTENRPVKGTAEFEVGYAGAKYRFASAANKQTFEADPARYAPQFGGFCAWAVSRGYTASIDPRAFQIVDGRLLLQYSLKVRDDFNQDTAGNLAKADANWPGLLEKKGR